MKWKPRTPSTIASASKSRCTFRPAERDAASAAGLALRRCGRGQFRSVDSGACTSTFLAPRPAADFRNGTATVAIATACAMARSMRRRARNRRSRSAQTTRTGFSAMPRPTSSRSCAQRRCCSLARALRDTAIRAVAARRRADRSHDRALHAARTPPAARCLVYRSRRRRSGHGLSDLSALLGHYCGVVRHRIPLDGEVFVMPTIPGLAFAAHALRSNAPPYSPRRDRPVDGDNNRARNHRSRNEPLAILRAGPVRDRRRRVRRDGARRLRARRRHLLARRRARRARASRRSVRATWAIARSTATAARSRCSMPCRNRRARCSSTSTTRTRSSDEDSAEHAAVRARGVEIAFGAAWS